MRRGFITWVVLTSVVVGYPIHAATNGILPGAVIEPDFVAGLAALKRAIGIVEHSAGHSSTRWAPNLQLLIGLRAAEGSNQILRFVELTTLQPPTTNAAGKPWSPPLRTNHFGWAGANAASRKMFEYVSGLYPVRLRVFDPQGRLLKEGATDLPWELLTNSLAETCRITLSTPAADPPGQLPDRDEFVRPFLGGMLSLITVFGEIQSAPALSDVCEKARCTVRMPGLWSMIEAAVGRSLEVTLQPRFKDVAASTPGQDDPRYYRVPLDMKNGRELLTTIDVIAGPSAGANVLLAGIRSIRAVHPAKTNHVFSAQVLAAGVRDAARQADEARTRPSTGDR